MHQKVALDYRASTRIQERADHFDEPIANVIVDLLAEYFGDVNQGIEVVVFRRYGKAVNGGDRRLYLHVHLQLAAGNDLHQRIQEEAAREWRPFSEHLHVILRRAVGLGPGKPAPATHPWLGDKSNGVINLGHNPFLGLSAEEAAP